ncbi:MAG: hypothetical protein WAP51_00570 [Candidatus Sungiibacteriota bacterium]
MAKRKVTIEDLARMVKRGFDETATKEDLKSVNQRIESFEKWAVRRFDMVDLKLREIDKKLRNVVYRHEFEALEGRVKDMEDLLAVVTKRR